MNEYILKTLLAEYLRQLQTALDAAQSELQQQMEPERYRRWNDSLIHFSLPSENTPVEQWHWEEEYPTHPALVEMQETIERIEAFVDGIDAEDNP